MALSVAGTFQHIFAQISDSPDYTLLQDIDLCPTTDRENFRDMTNNISATKERCLHDLILEQCRLRPNQRAIQSWDGDLTYGELDDLSSKLAWHLKDLGVGPEVFVLSCFEKSTWATVARLAILRAGGAYISIHASNPPAYLASVIERSKTQILLTDPYFADRFRDVVPTVVEISPAWLRDLPSVTEASVCDAVRPDNACLILFTSGSTGMPKGIIQSHSSYATAIQDYARRLYLGSHTRFLQFDDYAFDISNLEFLVPLILGGCCCVPKPTNSVQHLTEQIRLLNANIVFLTPTVAIKIEPLDVPCLETICVGGEPLSKELITKWDGQKTKLVNQYGMGEVAICCVLNDNVDISDNAKVGKPPTGAIWIVDPASPGRLMPIGAVGEILIEGPHLARGYLDSTALKNTSAGFLKSTPRWMKTLHPDRTNARMYRSGDLGCWNSDGTITHLGRKDTILKLDGCRIDALEVEHQAHKSLTDKDTVVVDLLGTADGQGDPSLTLFMYLDGHPTSMSPRAKGVPALVDAIEDIFAKEKVQEIRLGIAQALPRYMIPTKWILCTWIPRTASKKIDRKKLHLLGQIYHSAQPGGLNKDTC
jgi:amino acid adenylation domain-containing protein